MKMFIKNVCLDFIEYQYLMKSFKLKIYNP